MANWYDYLYSLASRNRDPYQPILAKIGGWPEGQIPTPPPGTNFGGPKNGFLMSDFGPFGNGSLESTATGEPVDQDKVAKQTIFLATLLQNLFNSPLGRQLLYRSHKRARGNRIWDTQGSLRRYMTQKFDPSLYGIAMVPSGPTDSKGTFFEDLLRKNLPILEKWLQNWPM